MFCGKCGVKNEDTAVFCKNCGTKLNGSTSTKATVISTPGEDNKNRKVGLIAVGIAAILIVILGIFLFGGRSYKTVIKKFVEAEFDADAKAIFNLMPEKVIDYALEQDGYDSHDLDDVIDEAEEYLQDQTDSLDNYLGEDWTLSYEILYTETLKGDDLDDIKELYEDTGVKISAAKNAEVEITISSDETENSSMLDVSLIKVGRSWYLDIINMGAFF